MNRRTPSRSILLLAPALALVFAAATLALLTPAPASAQMASGDIVAALDPDATHVTFDLGATGHDVHGTFDFVGGAIRFDPLTGAASGELVADATSGNTGNDSRDKTMNNKVLESELFPTFTLRVEKVVGSIAAEGPSTVTIEGVLDVHGGSHPVSIEAEVERTGDRFTATTTFPVPYVEWGLHDPSILFLRVEKVVQVTVETEGTLAPATDHEMGDEMGADGR